MPGSLLLYQIQRNYKTQISAIGVFVHNKDPAERHVHLILESPSDNVRQLDNRKGIHGTRPELPVRLKSKLLDHADALDISPIDDRDDVNNYSARNYLEGAADGTDIIIFNQQRLEELKQCDCC